MKTITGVCVPWRQPQPQELWYANRLALSANLPLNVAVPLYHSRVQQLLRELKMDQGEYLARVQRDVGDTLAYVGGRSGPINLVAYDGTAAGLAHARQSTTLFVTQRFGIEMQQSLMVYAGGQKEYVLPNRKNVLVALGNEADAEATARHALFGIEKLLPDGGEVVLYHTTWPNESIASAEPREHVCEAALRVLGAAETLLRVERLPYRVVVEMAETVVDGIATAALRHQASLVVIARDQSVQFGDYASQLVKLMTGSVPVLVLPAKEIFHVA